MQIDKSSLERILENLHDGLYLVDLNRKITYWNPAAERITGFTAAEVIGKHCYDNILNHTDSDGCQLCTGACPLVPTIEGGKSHRSDLYLRHKKGHRIPISTRVTPLTDAEGSIIGGIELFSDISHRAANELRVQELEQLALIDPLTQLANRTHLEHEIQNWLEEHKRFQVPFGVLFIDADHFKNLNDTYGHATGDEVLKNIAGTFAANSRPFDIYGRWGGEEFVGLIRHIDAPNLEMLGNRIRTLVEQSYLVREDKRIQVTISMGATLVRDGDDAESLIHRADELMYRSKADGRNCLTLG